MEQSARPFRLCLLILCASIALAEHIVLKKQATVFWAARSADPLEDVVGGQNLLSSGVNGAGGSADCRATSEGFLNIKSAATVFSDGSRQNECFFYRDVIDIGESVSGYEHAWSVWLKPATIPDDGWEKTVVHFSPHAYPDPKADNQYFVWFVRSSADSLNITTPAFNFDMAKYGLDGTRSGAFFDGKWHHLVGTHDSQGSYLYYDGALVHTNPMPTSRYPYRNERSRPGWNNCMVLGLDQDGQSDEACGKDVSVLDANQAYIGGYDNFAWFNKRLSAPDVLDIYEYGRVHLENECVAEDSACGEKLICKDTDELAPSSKACEPSVWYYKDTPGSGPSARRHAAMATIDNIVYLFGGQAGDGRKNDLWSANASIDSTIEWSQVSTSSISSTARWGQGDGPPAERSMHSMVSVLSWFESAIGPAVEDHPQPCLAVFGGRDSSNSPLGDLWVLNIITSRWFRLEFPGDAPTARSGHAAVSVGDRMWMFGGSTGEDSNELHSLDFSDKRPKWAKGGDLGERPGPRRFHSMAVAGGVIYIFGGSTSIGAGSLSTRPAADRYGGHKPPSGPTRLNDLWSLDVTAWRPTWVRHDTVTKYRYGPFEGVGASSTVLHRAGGILAGLGRSLFIYGGYNDDPAHNLHDLWGLDTTADALEWVWYNSPSNMVARHSSAHIVAYGELIVFGGVDGGGVLLQDTLRAKLACPKGSRGPLPLKPELSTLCVQCSPGNYTAVDGETACKTCGAGTFSEAGSSTCTVCPQGSFSGLPEQGACNTCQPGSYAPLGATFCASCAPGSVSATHGSGSCDLCPPMTYMPTSGGTACLECPDGGMWRYGDVNYTTLSTIEGSSECIRNVGLLYKADGARCLDDSKDESGTCRTISQINDTQVDRSGNRRTTGTGHVVAEEQP